MTADLAVYQAAKAAVIGMTRPGPRSGPDKIRLNTITPGWIMTQRQIDLWLTPAAEAGLMQAAQGEALSAGCQRMVPPPMTAGC
jgi:NAD(P)-dependent dehydrogenase (short-subunit alcohol dehydrogenase family)